jgi:hypothetical protein
MAYITFDDGSGTILLRNTRLTPGDRFANWIPANYRPFGGGAHTLADETRHVFTLRTDYGASFEVRGLGMGNLANGSLDYAERLMAHLLNGGTCAVYPQDTPAASYTNCGLAPGTTPTLTQTDARALEYTLSLAVLNLDGAAMTCHYAAA